MGSCAILDPMSCCQTLG